MAAKRQPLTPGQLLEFIDLPGFTARWDALGLTEADRLALEWQIMERPTGPPIVRGTRGFRKDRFAPPSVAGIGQSGAVRVWYAYAARFGTVLLGSVYGKTETGNLSDAQKRQLGELYGRFEALLEAWHALTPNERMRRRQRRPKT